MELYNGDCLEIMKDIKDNSIDLIVTDPPYRVTSKGSCGTPDLLKIPVKKLKDKNGKNLHDTEKPVELMQLLIENGSNKNDLVLEPFLGIGSTGIACINSDRDFIGIEIDQHYFSIAENRIKAAMNSKQLALF